MVGLAIDILWLCIGIIVLLGCIWIVLYVIKLFCAIPYPVEKAIWAIAMLLCLIGGLSLLAGGGGSMHFPRIGSLQQNEWSPAGFVRELPAKSGAAYTT
jgi:hypothetical protein